MQGAPHRRGGVVVAIVSLCAAGCGTTRGAESESGDRPEMTVGNIHGFFRVKSADEIVDPVAGAAVTPPAGPGWYVGQGHAGTDWFLMFSRMREPGDTRPIVETTIISYSFTHRDVAALRAKYQTEHAMLEAGIAGATAIDPNSPRFKRVSENRPTFRTIDGCERAYFDETIEERGNAADPSAVLVARNVGILGVNPLDATQTFYVVCSDRTLRGTTPNVDLDALLEQTWPVSGSSRRRRGSEIRRRVALLRAEPLREWKHDAGRRPRDDVRGEFAESAPVPTVRPSMSVPA